MMTRTSTLALLFTLAILQPEAVAARRWTPSTFGTRRPLVRTVATTTTTSTSSAAAAQNNAADKESTPTETMSGDEQIALKAVREQADVVLACDSGCFAFF